MAEVAAAGQGVGYGLARVGGRGGHLVEGDILGGQLVGHHAVLVLIGLQPGGD